MASAVLEAVDAGGDTWADVDITIEPGITAMLAAAARAGAPLGADFCVVSLSDNLKPWSVVENRLRLAAQADFAMASTIPPQRHGPAVSMMPSLSCAKKSTTPRR